jgi:hypothetical protein
MRTVPHASGAKPDSRDITYAFGAGVYAVLPVAVHVPEARLYNSALVNPG